MTIGSVIGLTLAIPTAAALIPDVDPGHPTWTGMNEDAWKLRLQATHLCRSIFECTVKTRI